MVAFCHQAGLTREKHIARFAEIVFLHLGGFPESRFPREALSSLYAYGMEPDKKLSRFELWARGTTQPHA
jgi:hypothetical protein